MREKLPQNLEGQQFQEQGGEGAKGEKESASLSSEEILNLSPKETVALFEELDGKGELESFLEKSVEDPSLVAQFSYWEKWLEEDHRKLVDEAVAKKKKVYEGKEDKESLPLHLEERFTDEELSIICSGIGAIQLSHGCSKGCTFCGFDAVPGTREHMPYSQLANLFERYGKNLGESQPLLYHASEPTDYTSKEGPQDKTYKYQDVHQLAMEYAGYNPEITSKETNDEQWMKYLGVQSEGEVKPGAKPRVSVFDQRPDKAVEIKEKYGGKIRTTGEGISQIKGIGKSLDHKKTSKTFRAGIGFVNGVLITPRGVYGVAQLPISSEFPQGQIVAPLEKISDAEIKAGDKLKNVLRRSVIVGPVHGEGKQKFPLSSKYGTVKSESGELYNEYENFIEGKYRKQVDIRTSNKLYRVWYDENGIIQSAWEPDVDKEKEIKERYREYDKKVEESLAEAKKRHMDGEKKITDKGALNQGETLEERNKKLFIATNVDDKMRKAIEEGRFHVQDERMTDSQVSKIKQYILNKGMSSMGPVERGRFSDTGKSAGWEFGQGWDFDTEAGFIRLEILCEKDNDNLSVHVVSDRSEREESERMSREFNEKNKEEINNRVTEAIGNGDVEFLTKRSKEENHKIIQVAMEASHLYRSKLTKEYETYRADVEVLNVGKVSLVLTSDRVLGKKKGMRLCVV